MPPLAHRGSEFMIYQQARKVECGGLGMKDITRRDAIRLVAAVPIAVCAPVLSRGAEKAPLAIKGYDPVAYFTEKLPMRGDPQFEYEWDGATYQFAFAKHLEMFKADPDRYLPQYSNLCAASVAKGIKYEGNPEYWLVVDGRLYLFGGPQGPGLMMADPAMTRRADENYPKVSRLPGPAAQ
jgi:YHS domain-containing protein